MGLVQTFLPHEEQPQEFVGVDTSNPLSAGLRHFLVASVPFDLVTGQALAYTAAPTKSLRPQGVSLMGIAGATNGVAYLTIPTTTFANNEITLVALCEVRSTYSMGGGINTSCGLANTAGNQLFCLQPAPAVGGNTWTTRQTNGGGTTVRLYSANAATVNTGAPAVVAGRLTSSSNIDAFWNGAPDSGTLTTGSSGANAWNRISIGGITRSSVLGAQEDNNVQALLAYNRALTDIEIFWISRNIYQVLQPVRRLMWSADAFSGATHSSAGALAATAATIAGVAQRYALHGAAGALAADHAVIAGTATRTTVHQASGALLADPATIAGTAVRHALHQASGALVADAAAITGTASHAAAGQHSSDGALIAGPASIDGTVARFPLHGATGALVGDAASISGLAVRTTTHTMAGALVAGEASISGQAQVGDVVARLGGFEMVSRVREVYHKPLLKKILEERAPIEPVTLPNKEKRRKAKLIETIAAKVVLEDATGAEQRYQQLLSQWKALEPIVAHEPLPAADAYRVFTAQVAQQLKRIQDEDDEEAIALLFL